MCVGNPKGLSRPCRMPCCRQGPGWHYCEAASCHWRHTAVSITDSSTQGGRDRYIRASFTVLSVAAAAAGTWWCHVVFRRRMTITTRRMTLTTMIDSLLRVIMRAHTLNRTGLSQVLPVVQWCRPLHHCSTAVGLQRRACLLYTLPAV